MPDGSISFTDALSPEAAAAALSADVEAELGGPSAVTGALLLSTAAAGGQSSDVARRLVARWPDAELVGTSFEGLIDRGVVYRDRPALGLLAWRGGHDREAVPLAFEPQDCAPDRIADEVLAAVDATTLGPRDLVLLFPDAHGLPPIAPMLSPLARRLGSPALAGAAASGLDGAPAAVFAGREAWRGGGLVVLVVPGAAAASPSPALVRVADASRITGSWLEVSACRSRWIDALEGEAALSRLRRVLEVDRRGASLAPHLGRLLVRLRRTRGRPARGPAAGEGHDDECYIVGLDEARGAFSMPIEIERGDWIAFAWPDADLARQRIRSSLDTLAPGEALLHFSCRARDAELHGDPDVESAWVAAHAGARAVLGTVAPFQLGPGREGSGEAGAEARMLVHSSVLASIGWPPC